MSHAQKQPGKMKNVQQELEELQHTREMVEEARAELLKHHPALQAHEEHEAAKSAPEYGANYIKHEQDIERIGHNTFNDNSVSSGDATMFEALQSNWQQAVNIHMRNVAAFHMAWLDMLGAMCTLPSEKNRR